MILGRLFTALTTAALAAGLILPAGADQTFSTVSTGPLPSPQKTAAPGQISIDYVYYPCGLPNGGRNGRFNPFDARDHNGPLTSYRHGKGRYDPCGYGRRPRKPGPPRRIPVPPGPRRVPLARHT